MISEVSIVIPVHNEQENIDFLIDEITDALRDTPVEYEIIYVDDASTDNSLQLLKKHKAANGTVRVLHHQTRCGQSTAISTGVRHAHYDWIITMDGDGQNDPADIVKFLQYMSIHPRKEDVGLIIGWRKTRRDSRIRKLSSRIANAVRSRLLGDNTPDTGCGLKLFPRRLFLKLPYFDHMHRFLPALIQREKYQVISLEVNHRPRNKGYSKYGINNRLWVGIIDLIGVNWLRQRAKVAETEEVFE